MRPSVGVGVQGKAQVRMSVSSIWNEHVPGRDNSREQESGRDGPGAPRAHPDKVPVALQHGRPVKNDNNAPVSESGSRSMGSKANNVMGAVCQSACNPTLVRRETAVASGMSVTPFTTSSYLNT